MARTLTVGLDGTRESVSAADWAAREARQDGATVRLLQVRAADPYLDAAVVRHGDLGQWSEEILDEVSRTLADRYPEVRTERRTDNGRPAQLLADASEESDLLVIGSRSLSTVWGYVIGSVALPTVSKSSCPVVLVRAQATGRSRELGEEGAASVASNGVLLGIELESPHGELLSFAYEMAERHQLPLTVLHGWEPPSSAGVRPMPFPPSMTEEMLEEHRQALKSLLAPWRERYPDVRLQARTVLAQPAGLLVDAANDAALLVIGRRARHSPLGPRTGPVAHAVMHHARSPVAVVPHG